MQGRLDDRARELLRQANPTSRIESTRRQDGSIEIPNREAAATIRPFDVSEILVPTTSQS